VKITTKNYFMAVRWILSEIILNFLYLLVPNNDDDNGNNYYTDYQLPTVPTLCVGRCFQNTTPIPCFRIKSFFIEMFVFRLTFSGSTEIRGLLNGS